MNHNLKTKKNLYSFLQTQNNEPKNYGSAKNYAQAVANWYHASQMWSFCQQMTNHNLMLSQQYAAMSAWNAAQQQNTIQQQQQSQQTHQQQPQQVQPQQQQVLPNNNRGEALRLNLMNMFRLLPNQQNGVQTLIIQQHTIPSFFRRIAAEAIDFFLLFMFKLIIFYMLLEFEIIDIDQFDNIFGATTDIQTLLNVTQDILNIEIFCKILSAIIEAFFITYGFMNYPLGCTPGKFLMKLRIISCVDIQPIIGSQDRVTVTSLPFVGIKSSLTRSLLKNTMTIFLFPLSTAFCLFQYKRAIYDLAAKTIVVNTNNN